MLIENNAIFRYGVILVAGIEALIWLVNLPSFIGLAGYIFSGPAIGFLAIIPIIGIPLLCIAALVFALRARRLNLAGGLAGLAAVLFFVG